MAEITIWSDLLCPWSYVAALRLHRTRDHLDADRVTFDFRAWPRAVAEDNPPDGHEIRNDMATLAQVERASFSAFGRPSFGTDSTLAFEAQKWAYSQGQDLGERFDLALRRALFLHSHDLGSRHELLDVAKSEGLDSSALAAALDSGRFRAAVAADVEEGTMAGVQETPRLDLGDGGSHVNPGISFSRVRGIALLEGDHPSVYEEIIRTAAMDH